MIYDCFLTSIFAVQTKAVRASFLLVGDLSGIVGDLSGIMGDLSGNRQEWLGSMTTNPHGVAAFDFATLSDCD